MKNRKCQEVPPENLNVEVEKETGGFFRKGNSKNCRLQNFSNFISLGQVGDGQKTLTEEDKAKIDKWIKKNIKNRRDQFEKIVVL